MPVQPRNAMCSSAWADPGKPGGVSSPPTLKFSSTVTTGASALRTMTTCKPLESVARVTFAGSAACKRDVQAVSRNSKDSRAFNFTSIFSEGEFLQGRPVTPVWHGAAVRDYRCSLQRHNIHPNFQAVFGAPEQHPANRADVAVIPTPRQGNVAIGRDAVVGGVEIHPAKARAPGRTPGMGGVGSHQAGAAGGRKGAQISADITCRQSQRAHAGDL